MKTYLCSRGEGMDLECGIMPHKVSCRVPIGRCQSHSCGCSLLCSDLPGAALQTAQELLRARGIRGHQHHGIACSKAVMMRIPSDLIYVFAASEPNTRISLSGGTCVGIVHHSSARECKSGVWLHRQLWHANALSVRESSL